MTKHIDHLPSLIIKDFTVHVYRTIRKVNCLPEEERSRELVFESVNDVIHYYLVRLRNASDEKVFDRSECDINRAPALVEASVTDGLSNRYIASFQICP